MKKVLAGIGFVISLLFMLVAILVIVFGGLGFLYGKPYEGLAVVGIATVCLVIFEIIYIKTAEYLKIE